MWQFALLEIYRFDSDRWPEKGTPADWIHNGEVAYCDGEPRNYVLLAIPWWKLAWWLVADIPTRIRLWMWERRRTEEDDGTENGG